MAAAVGAEAASRETETSQTVAADLSEEADPHLAATEEATSEEAGNSKRNPEQRRRKPTAQTNSTKK